MTQPTQFTKDPDATLDYRFDWSLWLDDGEAIVEADILADQVDVDTVSHTDRDVTVFLSGGQEGERAEVTCRVTTSEGRIDDRTIRLRLRQR